MDAVQKYIYKPHHMTMARQLYVDYCINHIRLSNPQNTLYVKFKYHV